MNKIGLKRKVRKRIGIVKMSRGLKWGDTRLSYWVLAAAVPLL